MNFGELAKIVINLINSLKALIFWHQFTGSTLVAASEETSMVTAQTTRSIQEQKTKWLKWPTATSEMHRPTSKWCYKAQRTYIEIKFVM